MSDKPPQGGVAAALRPQAPRSAESAQALPAGHRLHEFTIEALVHAGSHSLLYTAHDNVSQRTVAIKEYMPAQWAHRLPDHSVALRSRRHGEAFALGLGRFVGDARQLAAFDHPSLQKVLRLWEGHGTAYAVMPYYPGQTLRDWLQTHEEPPQERWLKELLRPLLDALEVLHGGNCLHRDIAPENILLLSGHRPVLLGLGTRVTDEGAPALFLRPGYAPIEQYAESAALKQGPWTDLYALCAVLHAAVLGHAPVPSVARQIKDEQAPVARAAAGRYSDPFLRAIDTGLAVLPAHRPQDVATLRALFFPEMFVLTEPAELDAPAAPTASRPPAPVPGPAPGPAPAAAAAAREKGPVRPTTPATAAPRTAARPMPPIRPRPDKRRSGSLAALAGMLVAAAAGAWWWLGPHPPDWDLASMKALVTRLAAPAPQPEPFSIVRALEQVVRQSDPTFAVSARPDKSPLVVGRDRLRFHVQSSQPGYLYLFLTGTDAAHLWLLFPNQADNDNLLEADNETVVPRGGWHITASGPPGVDHVVALVTRYPMDLDSVGLRRDGDVHELDPVMAARRWAEHPEPGSPLVGPPVCPADLPVPCEQRFGAALMRIEEVAPSGASN